MSIGQKMKLCHLLALINLCRGQFNSELELNQNGWNWKWIFSRDQNWDWHFWESGIYWARNILYIPFQFHQFIPPISCSVTSFRYKTFNVHSCFLTLRFCVNLTFQYINHSCMVLHKYARYLPCLLAIKINNADTTFNRSSSLYSKHNSCLFATLLGYFCVWIRDQLVCKQSTVASVSGWVLGGMWHMSLNMPLNI